MLDSQGTEVLLMATSDRLPSHPIKYGRATDSCFALLGIISVAYWWLVLDAVTHRLCRTYGTACLVTCEYIPIIIMGICVELFVGICYNWVGSFTGCVFNASLGVCTFGLSFLGAARGNSGKSQTNLLNNIYICGNLLLTYSGLNCD